MHSAHLQKKHTIWKWRWGVRRWAWTLLWSYWLNRINLKPFERGTCFLDSWIIWTEFGSIKMPLDWNWRFSYCCHWALPWNKTTYIIWDKQASSPSSSYHRITFCMPGDQPKSDNITFTCSFRRAAYEATSTNSCDLLHFPHALCSHAPSAAPMVAASDRMRSGQ